MWQRIPHFFPNTRKMELVFSLIEIVWCKNNDDWVKLLRNQPQWIPSGFTSTDSNQPPKYSYRRNPPANLELLQSSVLNHLLNHGATSDAVSHTCVVHTVSSALAFVSFQRHGSTATVAFFLIASRTVRRPQAERSRATREVSRISLLVAGNTRRRLSGENEENRGIKLHLLAADGTSVDAAGWRRDVHCVVVHFHPTFSLAFCLLV